LEVTESIWQEIIDTNLKGAFFCAQVVVRTINLKKSVEQNSAHFWT
jgi:NAD(P)-dependent dehydrogenase (short-subunit alcohol dehydrogenase family)